MADESNTLTEAREAETEYLNEWTNTHGDKVRFLRTEARDEDAPRYAIVVVPATKISARFEGADEPGDVVTLAVGDTKDETWSQGPYLSPRSPEDIGYDGLGDVHDNGRKTSTPDETDDDADAGGSMADALRSRLRQKYENDDGKLDYGALQKVAGKHDVSPVGHDAETLLEKIVDSRLDAAADGTETAEA